LILGSTVTFPEERQVKINLYAKEKFHAMRNVALMNATNTNRIPESYRDFYMEKETKKLMPWAHLFEGRRKGNLRVGQNKNSIGIIPDLKKDLYFSQKRKKNLSSTFNNN